MNAVLSYLANVNWALWLAILGLILMYPIAFIANVTTPIDPRLVVNLVNQFFEEANYQIGDQTGEAESRVDRSPH